MKRQTRIVLIAAFLLPLVFPTHTLQAQQQQAVQRLTTLLRSREARGLSDTTDVRLMLDLAQEYRKQNPAEALQYSRRAEELARALKDTAGLAMAFTSAGITNAQQGAWVRSLNYFLRSVQLKEQMNDQRGMAALLSNIGVVHGKLNDEERALNYHVRAARYFESSNDTKGLAYTYNNIGVIYMNRGELDEALRSFLKSVELKRELGDTQGLAGSYLNIGIALSRQKAFVRARENYEQAILLYQQSNDNYGLAEAYTRLGQLALQRKEFKTALRYGNLALELAIDLNARVIRRNAYRLCSEASNGMGDPTGALLFFKQYTGVKDSLFNEESSKLIHEMTANYETERREKSERENELLKKDQDIRLMELERQEALVLDQQLDIELLNKEKLIRDLELRDQEGRLREQHLLALEKENVISLLNKDHRLLKADQALSEAELDRQMMLRNALILGSIFLLIIVVLLANRYREKRRSADVLQTKNSELEQANEEIRRHEGLLREQAAVIERANEELKRQNGRLQQLNLEKSELLGIVAHDLRNPIGGIRMVTESMMEPGRSLEYLQQKAGRIHDSADNVLTLVRDLLDVNKLEAGGMTFDKETVEMRSITVHVVESFARWAGGKNIRVHVESEDGLPDAAADAFALARVLDNLVSNAIKYSPLDTDVKVVLRSDRDNVLIEVIDQGPGFTDKDKELLFKKFVKLSAEPTAGEFSTGLGLSIVKKLVEGMHGSVVCESEAGKGAKFTVRLAAIKESGS